MAIQNSISFVLVLLLLRSSFFFEKLSFDYIFQFGDSINDTGNHEWDADNFLCRRFPYGMFLPSGPRRCSDGLVLIDYFARFFNIPLSPYLEKGANLSHGVNFAVAGSTAIDASILNQQHIVSPLTNISLSVQLQWFKSHLNSMCSGELECKQKLRKALVFMGEIGGNDYNHALEAQKTSEELYELVPDVIQEIKNATKELIDLGAKTIILPGNFPIGCLPIYLTLFKTNDSTMYDDLKCLKNLNDLSKFHNYRLQEVIKELQQDYTHATIIYADYYSSLLWLIRKASVLGFDKEEVHKACCGIGANEYNFDSTRFCGDKGVPICDDPHKLISWDGVHSTQHAYQHIAQWLLQRIVPSILIGNHNQVV